MTTFIASAPGKVILLGEHGVNRRQPALATAVDMRARCRAQTRTDGSYTFSSGDYFERGGSERLVQFKAEIDEFRASDQLDLLRERTRADFFAPARYALAHVIGECREAPGMDLEWHSELPVGSGLGSGAAATAAMLLAAAEVLGIEMEPADIAHFAWQGDIVAHGGVASGLDSGACVLGGITCYNLADGPRRLPCDVTLPLLTCDTLVRAHTGDINTRVRKGLDAHPARARLFSEMGFLVEHAQEALVDADLPALGHLLNLNQLLLEKLGVSSAEIERLVEAALEAGALGAKLSGSGGGGVVIALANPGHEREVADAMEAAGGRSIVAAANAPGVRLEDGEVWGPLYRRGGSLPTSALKAKH
ncbi:MAG: mevalonate kinase [Chloroflexota bacterium]|nr:mevalonate kinase [Chloroflexota bacterium]